MARKRKRRLKKGIRQFLGLLVIGFLVFGIYKSYSYFTTDKTPTDKTTENPQKDTKPKQDEIYKLKFLATGDGLIHSVIFRYYKTDNGYDFTDAIKDVADITKNYDIVYYNQETPVGDSSIEYSGYPLFYTPSSYVDAMINIGFNTISLASNHSLDKGEKGILNSLNYFKTTDTLYNGMSKSNEERNNYIIKEKNNITYTMLSYTTLTNGLSTPSGKSYLLNTYSKEKVKQDIEAVRDKVDVLMVAMHWGVEYQNKPNAEQIEIAEYLSSLGVDIIIGNHPHILQPVAKINDTICFYSLGNFISNQYQTDDYNKLVGFLATLDITKTVHPNGNSEITYDNLGGELIYTKYERRPGATSTADNIKHHVVPFSKINNEILPDYSRIYDKYAGVLKNMGLELNITPAA